MHLVCLGTVKKLILLWIKDPIRVSILHGKLRKYPFYWKGLKLILLVKLQESLEDLTRLVGGRQQSFGHFFYILDL